MSVDILGTKYDSPIVLSPVGGQRSFNDDAEAGVARAAKKGNHLQILSTMTSDTVEEVIKAREAPIWMQLYATKQVGGGGGDHHARREAPVARPLVAITVDRSGGRNQWKTNAGAAAGPPTPAIARAAMTHSQRFQNSLKNRAMWKGLDLTGLRNTQSSNMTWELLQADARPRPR